MAWPWVINLGVQQPQGDASIIFARHKEEVRAITSDFVTVNYDQSIFRC